LLGVFNLIPGLPLDGGRVLRSIAWKITGNIQNTLQGVSVDKVMNPRPVAVPANISLQKLVNEYFVPQGLRAAPVVRGDLAGLITLTDIARVGRERWAYTPVGHVMRLLEQVYVTTPEQLLYDLLEVMVTRGINQIPVVQDGRLVGLLSRESILRYLQVRESLKMDEPRYAL
jgi:CBS domain-containing protein